MTISYFSGVETGDGSEIANMNLGAISTTVVRSGAYSLAPVLNSVSFPISALGATKSVVRTYAYFSGLTNNDNVIAETTIPSGGYRTLVQWSSGTSQLYVSDAGSTLGLTLTVGGFVQAGTWYRIELAIDLAAGGAIKVWVNGVLSINVTHTNNVSATPTDGYSLWSGAAQTYFDDFRIDTATLTPPGAGSVIARQGKTGTPNYNAWTKNGAATSALCWSNTPFTTGTNCSDNVLNDAQTMLVAPFSTAQSGHGGSTISPNDTINACKVAMIAKTAVAGNITLRRRVGGVDTDVTKALTTADAYYQTAFFTDTPANLDAYEIGVANALVATLETVEDMWLMVDFTESLMAQAIF